MVELRPIQSSERERLRQIVEVYWQELMPHADVVRDAERRDRYFQQRFPLDERHHPIQWAIVEGHPVGFIAATVDPTRNQATVHDFFVLPAERRRGYGTAIVNALYRQFDWELNRSS
ncbi:GNAT family N-acetyltransferase [Chloroflexi bacterium TSY]|nr:GNAT family N-acetyltransferase [Chloroflexi bacterium TSY]